MFESEKGGMKVPGFPFTLIVVPCLFAQEGKMNALYQLSCMGGLCVSGQEMCQLSLRELLWLLRCGCQLSLCVLR